MFCTKKLKKIQENWLGVSHPFVSKNALLLLWPLSRSFSLPYLTKGVSSSFPPNRGFKGINPQPGLGCKLKNPIFSKFRQNFLVCTSFFSFLCQKCQKSISGPKLKCTAPKRWSMYTTSTFWLGSKKSLITFKPVLITEYIPIIFVGITLKL